jgi:hypothetical protein
VAKRLSKCFANGYTNVSRISLDYIQIVKLNKRNKQTAEYTSTDTRGRRIALKIVLKAE